MRGWIIGAGLTLALAGCATDGTEGRSDLIAAPTHCAPVRMDIYFRDDEAGLTQPARDALAMTADVLKGCAIQRVLVIGLADARGGAAANLNLSQRRAQNVIDTLAELGLPAPSFEAEAYGDEGATTAAGSRAPMRRRTEVVIDAAPR